MQEKKFFSPILCDYSGDLDKRWRVEYYVPDTENPKGKRIVVYGDINKYRKAQLRYIAATNIINSILAEYHQPQVKTSILDQVKDRLSLEWRPATLQAYTTIIKYFSEHYPAHDRCTTNDINDFLIHLKKSGKSNTTIKKYRDALAYLYKQAVRMNLLKYSPVDTDFKIKKAPQSLEYFNDKEIAQIRDYVQEHNKQLWLAIQLLYYCFIRPREMRAMQVSWINIEHRYIEIPGVYSKNKKTEKVIIPDAFINQLKEVKKYPSNYLVIASGGEPGLIQIGLNTLNNQHSKILNKLAIRGRYAFYSWKHTGAVKCVKAGINLKDLQLQLRHHSLDMVNEYLKNLGVMDSIELKIKFPTI